MGHGTTEYEAPTDHTAERLVLALDAAEKLAGHARANVKEAEINLSLAKLAADRAEENEEAARKRWRSYRDKERA